MKYVNYFVQDIMDLFENRLIQIRDNMVMVDQKALYSLSATYKMDTDDILYFLQKITKFAELPNGRNDK